MHQIFNEKIEYLIGDKESIEQIFASKTMEPFEETVIEFLDEISKRIFKSKEAKNYADIITFAFWIRKSNVLKMREKYYSEIVGIKYMGRGVVFHIAPSNVAMNYAYSLVTGLLMGNMNIIKVSSKKFEQVDIVNDILAEVLSLKMYKKYSNYIDIIRYENEKEINDFFSMKCAVRIIWGGNKTIDRLRESPMQPRATEIAFADRYSICVIDADEYCLLENKDNIAKKFYNDTYLNDQNACTSPKIVVWYGKTINMARELFWKELHNIVKEKYTFHDIYSLDKLTMAYKVAVSQKVQFVKMEDSLLTRLEIVRLESDITQYFEKCGFFYEYCIDDRSKLHEIEAVVNNTRCQTISYIGQVDAVLNLLSRKCDGIDRIVPVGQTMDFDLIWDGYNLFDELTRKIAIY